MMRVLVRHHSLLRPATIKWLLMAVSVCTLWLGTMTLRRGDEFLAGPWLSLSWLWIVTAVYLVSCPHHERTREFVLTLPVPVRTVWRAHVAALLLTSGALTVAVLGIAHLGLLGLRAINVTVFAPLPGLAGPMLNWWCHGLAWWLLLAALVLQDQPGVASLPRDRRWRLRQAARLALATVGMIGLGQLGPAAAALPLLAGVALIVRSFRVLPAAVSMVPSETLDAAPHRPHAPLTAAVPWWRRRPAWTVVLQATSKHPAMLMLAAVFIVLVGFSLSGWNARSDGGEHLGVFMIPITAYMIFALAGTPLLKISMFAHLPLSLPRLLAYLLVPQVVLLMLGFGLGEVIGQRTEARGDFISWSNGGERYGVRIAPRYFAVARDEVPTSIAPDGTPSTPPADWRPLGDRGPILYKPYHVSPGADLDFCAWQLQRAIERVYGTTIPRAEIRERFLDETDDGFVGWRDDAPTIREAYPDLTPARFRGLAPLQFLAIGLLFQLTYAGYLATFRPGVSDGIRKAAFVLALAVLMVLYLAPFVLGIADLGDPVGMNVLVIAGSDILLEAMPGGLVGMWLVTIAVLGVGHALMLQQFRRAEWPPVREDDGFTAVVG